MVEPGSVALRGQEPERDSERDREDDRGEGELHRRREAVADLVLDRPAYNFVIHTSPVHESNNDYYHWHIEFMPKLTKVAGFEWGTGFYINPTPPEEAAKFLREASVEEPVPTPVG